MRGHAVQESIHHPDRRRDRLFLLGSGQLRNEIMSRTNLLRLSIVGRRAETYTTLDMLCTNCNDSIRNFTPQLSQFLFRFPRRPSVLSSLPTPSLSFPALTQDRFTAAITWSEKFEFFEIFQISFRFPALYSNPV